MVGRRNESGEVAYCNHCGYRWYYQGQRSVTSCPNCQWRVRIRPTPHAEINQTPGDFASKPKDYPRYY